MTSAAASARAPDTDVLIVGAGPTGLVLAAVLARAGVRLRLIDRAAGPQPGSRAKGVQPRTLEIFDQLGIIDEVLADGQMDMPICSIDLDGRETHSGGGAPAPSPDTPYPASVTTPLPRVEAALRRRLEELGGQVEFGTELIGYSQSDTGVAAALRTADGDQDISARWLVGCDSGHSLVRKLAGIGFTGMTFDSARMILADVRVRGLDRSCWRLWRHADGFIGLCPLPSTELFQFQASINARQDAALSLGNMQAILDARAPGADIILDALDWASLWRANIRLADRYRAGRVLIAGDAAHVHAPSGGQGMNTGVQDAYNLGWKLAAVLAGADELLIDSYEAERRPIAAGVIALSRELGRESLAARGITIPRDGRTWELDLNYRGSALARDDRPESERLRAGDRAPDATGLVTAGGERRLFDLLRHGDFTLLAFGRGIRLASPLPCWLSLRVLPVVGTLIEPGDILDAEGQLSFAYGARDGTAVLIRPDGYIAMVADRDAPAALAAYFAQFGA